MAGEGEELRMSPSPRERSLLPPLAGAGRGGGGPVLDTWPNAVAPPSGACTARANPMSCLDAIAARPPGEQMCPLAAVPAAVAAAATKGGQQHGIHDEIPL